MEQHFSAPWNAQQGSGLVDGSGKPLSSNDHSYRAGPGEPPLPHVISFMSIMGSAFRGYWQNRHDEALRTSLEDAVAMRRDAFLGGLLKERYLMTSSLNWHLETPSEKMPVQRAMRDGMQIVARETWRLSRMTMSILDAIWYGRMGVQLAYKWKELDLPVPNFKAQEPGFEFESGGPPPAQAAQPPAMYARNGNNGNGKNGKPSANGKSNGHVNRFLSGEDTKLPPGDSAAAPFVSGEPLSPVDKFTSGEPTQEPPYMAGAPAVGTVRTEKRRCKVISKHFPVNGDKIGHQYDHTPFVLVWGATSEKDVPGGTFIWSTLNKALLLDKPYFRERFIIHANECVDMDFMQESDMAEAIHGLGVRHFVYWWWWLKSEWLANVSDWVERAGLGVRIWYFQGGNEASRQEVAAAAKQNMRRTNILVPRYGDAQAKAFEWEDVQTGGPELLLKLQNYVDQILERYILGQTVSSSTTGSQGAASLLGASRAKIAAHDANNLAETYTEDWIRVTTRDTYQVKDPSMRWVFDVEQSDALNRLETINKAYSMGVSFREDDVRAITGMDAPGATDKVISDAMQRQSIGGMPSPGGAPGAPGAGGQPPSNAPPEDLQEAGEAGAAGEDASPDAIIDSILGI